MSREEVAALGLADVSAAADPPTLQLWMGEAGVGSNLHADGMDNFFLQAVGRKQFFLWHPRTEGYTFPVTHPCARQSQLDVHSAAAAAAAAAPNNATHTAAAAQAKARFPAAPAGMERAALLADLGPGDMLYLPARWWHDVVADPQVRTYLLTCLLTY